MVPVSREGYVTFGSITGDPNSILDGGKKRFRSKRNTFEVEQESKEKKGMSGRTRSMPRIRPAAVELKEFTLGIARASVRPPPVCPFVNRTLSTELLGLLWTDSGWPNEDFSMNPPRRSLVLLTGASGYIGGRLLKALENAGWSVRCLARRPDFLRPRVAPSTEVVKADCLNRSSLGPAMAGVHTAYYFVHSMGSSGRFEQEDRQAAQNFADAARESGMRRIVYLGGLGNQDQALSAHLRSRHEVADILRSSGIPTIEFRASIVIGSGSLSFEMIRALVQRLPVMICPRWVAVKAQPIAVEDVIAYLMAALELPAEEAGVFEIGGTDQVSYGEIMQEYARQCGLRRCLIPVPVLTPRLSSLWLGLVTPVYARVGRKLIDSMRNPTLVRDPSALSVFHIKPKGLKEAVASALRHEDQEFAVTRWSDSLSSSGEPRSWGECCSGPGSSILGACKYRFSRLWLLLRSSG
jgi:uncharacterized protein YbjT (DUF2867 family)